VAIVKRVAPTRGKKKGPVRDVTRYKKRRQKCIVVWKTVCFGGIGGCAVGGGPKKTAGELFSSLFGIGTKRNTPPAIVASTTVAKKKGSDGMTELISKNRKDPLEKRQWRSERCRKGDHWSAIQSEVGGGNLDGKMAISSGVKKKRQVVQGGCQVYDRRIGRQGGKRCEKRGSPKFRHQCGGGTARGTITKATRKDPKCKKGVKKD